MYSCIKRKTVRYKRNARTNLSYDCEKYNRHIWKIIYLLSLSMVAFSIGSFSVYWYGIFYLISFLLGYFFLWYVGKRAKKKLAENKQNNSILSRYPTVIKLLTENLDDLMLALILGVILWWRVGYVLIYSLWYYIEHPSEIFALWHGWMSFIGGIIGVCVGLLIIKKLHKLSWKDFFVVTDLLLLIVPIGIILGRFGNFLNQELYGTAITTLPSNSIDILQRIGIAHIYPTIDNLVRRNTNILSIAFEGVVPLIVVRLVARKQWKSGTWNGGRITLTFLIIYSLARFFLEYLRQDSQAEFIWWFTITQWWMIGLWIGILLVRIVTKNTHKRKIT